MIFDSHAHLISSDQNKYKPTPLTGKLTPGEFDNPMTAEKLIQLMDKAGVAKACAVQRAHVYGYHNDYILDSAEQYPDRFSAVVVLNANDPTTPETLIQLANNRSIKGVRFIASSFPTSTLDWLTSKAAYNAWETATDLGLTICIHVLHVQRESVLPTLSQTARKFPAARIVVDHIGGAHSSVVELGWMESQGIKEEVEIHPAALAMSDDQNITMKLSSINFERLEAHHHSFVDFIDQLIKKFGSDRIIWGSDIGQSRGDYTQMVAMAQNATSKLNEQDRHAILYGNAEKLYG